MEKRPRNWCWLSNRPLLQHPTCRPHCCSRSPTYLRRCSRRRHWRNLVMWCCCRRPVPVMISIRLYDEAVHKLYFDALEIGHQPGVVPLSDLPREETMTWWVYQHQQPLVIPYVDTETRFPHLMARLKQYGMQSACGLPLTTL